MTKYCPECGAVIIAINDEDKICANCGFKKDDSVDGTLMEILSGLLIIVILVMAILITINLLFDFCAICEFTVWGRDVSSIKMRDRRS